MANSKMMDLEDSSDLHGNDVYDEQIEVIEQTIEEARDQKATEGIKELIFDSPLPAYVPILPPGFEVDTFYECEDCGDRFAVESSFQFHKDRRSLLIKYDCPDCVRTVTTYNRCSLLAHLRIHGTASRNSLDWDRVSVTPLPFDKMLIGPLFNIGEYEDTLSRTVESNNSNDSVKRCIECDTPLRGSLRDHFLGIGKGTTVDPNNKCRFCNMILTSKCSLKAHVRYHRQEQPFVCPDCAKIFNMWASFCVHLFYCCFHLDKCVRYRCPACKAILPTAVSLEVHVLTSHVKNVFKCNACPIACFSLQTLEEHKIKGHGHSSLPTNAYQQCQLCPDRLIPKARLLFHVIEHVRKPSVCIHGYQCSGCKMFYQKKSEFAIHKSQCTQHTSNSVDGTNGLVMFKLKNQIDNTLNQNPINGHTSAPAPISTNVFRKDTHAARTAKKTAACQTKTNASLVPKDSNRNNNIHFEKFDTSMKNKNSDDMAYTSHERSDTIWNISGLSNTNSENLNSKDGVTRCSNRQKDISLCDVCGEEFVNNSQIPYSDDVPILCPDCSSERPSPKPRTRRSSVRSENTLKGSPRNSVSNKNNNSSKGQTPVKRGKNSIALNGPNKKMRVENPDKDKYKCHICRALIGTEWEVIQEHFSKEHKNFNLLVLTPRINKIELGDTKSGKATSSAKKSSTTSTAVKKNCSNLERKNSNSNNSKKTSNSEKNILFPSSEKKNIPSNSEKKTASSNIEKKGSEKKASSSTEKRAFSSSEKKSCSSLSSEKKACSSLSEKKSCPPSSEKKASSSSDKKACSGSFEKSSDPNTAKRNTSLTLEKKNNSSNTHKKPCPFKPVKIKTEPADNVEDETEYEEPTAMRTRRKMPLRGVQNDPSLSESASRALQSPDKEKANRYTCFKCKYQSDTVEDFWAHIIIHKTDSRAFQCMECGMCFVAKPSFQKHLFISHKIKDVEKYINDHDLCHQKPKKENPQSDDPVSPCAEEIEELEENQCRVCRVKFETAVQLNKHFRTHGMAFLLMKQQENRSSK